MFRLGLCEKKYLYKNFTNASTASVIFLRLPEPIYIRIGYDFELRLSTGKI